MNITVLDSKIHRARVTDANLNYEGSISICTQLMYKADLLVNQKVDIVNVNNGERFSTYVIPGEKGQICLNGAASRKVQVDDIIIIIAYAEMDKTEARSHKPKLIFVDKDNNSPIPLQSFQVELYIRKEGTPSLDNIPNFDSYEKETIMETFKVYKEETLDQVVIAKYPNVGYIHVLGSSQAWY